MYRSLLYSAGGGIVSPEQQAEQACCANIFIGLGGTGIDCLKQVKKQIYEQIRPDNPNAVIPSYQHIKFLAVDADPRGLDETNLPSSLSKNTEFLDLRCADISALLHNAPILTTAPSLQWLKASATEPYGTGIKILNVEAGACGVRQIGRLLLFLEIPQFLDKLTSLIIQARDGLPAGTETHIHIFAGLGGGMGSGAFLDVCYLIQHVLSNLGIQGSTSAFGYFFMPDVNLSRIPDLSVQKYIKHNGFAAMQELDYCMDFETNGGRWKQDYGNGLEVYTTNPPVKLAYLISATDTAGTTRADAYQYAIHTVADYVMESLIRSKTDSCSATNDSSVIKGDLVELAVHIRMINKTHGACYNYCTLGAASAYIPYKEITTYLSAKIFENFDRLNYQLPTEAEMDILLQTCGLCYEDILKSMNHQVPAVPMYDVDKGLLYQQTAGITPDIIPQVLRQMQDSIWRIQGQMEVNQKALLTITPDIAVTNVSLIGRVKKQLMELAANPDKGPYFTAAILHSAHSKDLSYRIDGFIAENQMWLNRAISDMNLLENQMANALRDLQNSNFLNRSKRAEIYVQTVNKYFCKIAKIDLYQATANILAQFKRQISELYIQFFGIFERVFRELQSTFAENLSALSHPAAQNNDYAMKLLTIQELQPSLDGAVEAMNSNDLISGFVTYMLEHPDRWQAEDESKICHGVSNYFLDQLKDFTHRTMDDYLKIRFNTSDPGVISRKVLDEILLPLSQKAEPLFWTNPALYNIAESGKRGHCFIPEESQEINHAARDYRAFDPTVFIHPSYISDRISFRILRCGIPMFAYKGTDAYRNDAMIPGTHLYEGTTRDPRDWRKLFDITPYSCRTPETLTRELEERAKAVEEATQLGIREIFQENLSLYTIVINLYNSQAIAELTAKAEEILRSNAIDKTRDLLSDMMQHPLEPVEQKIMRTAERTSELADSMNRDILIASPVWCELLSRQIQLIKQYNLIQNQLAELIDHTLTARFDSNYPKGNLPGNGGKHETYSRTD